ncbi:O-linked N-acetylglucosamine transferase family protein [Microcoleus sp. AT3-D2]|uniref:O-linked N-acetylglucosamine transferase family protein n=1 Tax=Microcoleus sp. AT3-D2 TaxID=2818612 RepID=UPI002FCEED63
MVVFLENTSSTDLAALEEQAHKYLTEGQYTLAANLYEQAIATEPDTKSHYWNLGLMLLLQEQELEAQASWLLGMAEGEPEQIEQWTDQLIMVLQTEAERREALKEDSIAWAIRHHIREIAPTNINNLLYLLELSVRLGNFTAEELTSLGVIKLLKSEESGEVNFEVLMQVLKSILEYDPLHPSSLELAEACLTHVCDSQLYINLYINTVIPTAFGLATLWKNSRQAVHFAELCLRLDPNNLDIICLLSVFYQNAGQYNEGIKTAKILYSLAKSLPVKIYATHLVLRGLMSAGGYWEEAVSFVNRLQFLQESLIAEQPISLDLITAHNLFLTPFFFPYFRDEPKHYRKISNQLAQICQVNIQNSAKKQIELYRQRQFTHRKNISSLTKPLKIGYLSHCLATHAVGSLARWLIKYHDRERFQLHAYLINYRNMQDPLQEWYVNQVSKAYRCGIVGTEIAEQISQDEIDILIDLDSLTSDVSYEVIALKPAPVQITWLGWDASGLPTIDYFIADPYVLPESAQDYYSEKIWRLPQTYIAVDGFEVGVPTLRREQLDIPTDAVIYLSAQRGYKRHPDTARLQMKIISEVPNSYFIIKGAAEEDSIKKLFNELAQEEGIDFNRLRFLPEVVLSEVHRANLSIADVVLDTYPYNGATTTLETLWMGVPLVTKVGEQFAARNSYTMMMNAGINEGIAWTDEEYIEWGIRLGKDAALRQHISWKLRQSRQTAPLWNGKQFTREMEKAYEQMWRNYVEAGN